MTGGAGRQRGAAIDRQVRVVVSPIVRSRNRVGRCALSVTDGLRIDGQVAQQQVIDRIR